MACCSISAGSPLSLRIQTPWHPSLPLCTCSYTLCCLAREKMKFYLLDSLATICDLAGVPAPSPWWLSCLWPVLGTTLMHAFSTLQQRLILASIVGAAGGTASYLGGTRLSDIDFGDPIFGPMTIALIWAIAFPAMLAAARCISLRGVQGDAN